MGNRNIHLTELSVTVSQQFYHQKYRCFPYLYCWEYMIIDVVCYFNYRAVSPGVSNKSKEKPCMSTPAFSRIRWRSAFPKVLVLLALLFSTVFSLASHLNALAASPANAASDGPG